MRVSICTFAFLVLTPLAQAQLSTFGPGGPGQISCKDFSASRNLALGNTYVRQALERAMPGRIASAGGVGWIADAQPPDWPAMKMLGDGLSVGVLKTVSPKDLTKPEFVKAYLLLIRYVFSEPKWIVCPEDKTPEITVFLLDYLREKVTAEELQHQIDSTKQYVLNQTKVDSKPSGDEGRYTQVTSGLGILDGVSTALYSYRAPDGEIIVTVKATIGSADGVAAKDFHQRIDHSAAEIVKQADILDESGKVIGYRSVLTLVDKDGKKSTAILITRGIDFLQLTCASAADVLAFEDNYNEAMAAKHAKQ
jgi:hypothetical protein